MQTATKSKLTQRYLAIVDSFLDSQGEPFRRSALSKILYPATNPRSILRADELAAAAIKALAKAGRIVRHGHVHWTVPQSKRTLRSGRRLAVQERPVSLPIKSKTPEKWVAVDLETGDVWVGSLAGWTRADTQSRKDARAILGAANAC